LLKREKVDNKRAPKKKGNYKATRSNKRGLHMQLTFGIGEKNSLTGGKWKLNEVKIKQKEKTK